MIGSDGRTRHRLAALVAAFAGLPLIQDARRSPGPALAEVPAGAGEEREEALRAWIGVTVRRQALAVERAGSFLANGSVVPALLLALSWRIDGTGITDAAMAGLAMLETALVVEEAGTTRGPVEPLLRRASPEMRFIRVPGDAEDPIAAARRARDALLAV